MAPRSAYHHGDLPNALREAAWAHLRTGGLKGFSLRAVGRAVSVDVAAVYRHYRDRAALLQAVVDEARRAVDRRIDALPPTEGEDALRALVHELVRLAHEEPGGHELLVWSTGGAWPAPWLRPKVTELRRIGRCELPEDRATRVLAVATAGLAAHPEVTPATVDDTLDAVLGGLYWARFPAR